MRKIFFAIAAAGLVAAAPSQAQTPDGGRFDPLTISDTAIDIAAYPDGDRVPDFSFCGYMAGEEPLPDLFTRADIPVFRFDNPGGDCTGRLQALVDHVCTLPVREGGFRAVIFLPAGKYSLQGSLRISGSGVVLRGEGPGTILFGEGEGRETLIKISGKEQRSYGPEAAMECDYLPVNASRIPLGAGHGIKAGDKVRITRPSTREWIELLGADRIGLFADYNMPAWTPGDFDLNFDRTVVSADDSGITTDVPLPQSFDARYGGGYVRAYTQTGRIDHVAIENLTLESAFDPSLAKDENHRWMAVTIDDASDCWVRRVTVKHFVSSAVYLLPGASRITVEECKCLEPVGEIGGYRRIAFQTGGQQTLFNRCYSEEGYHDFAVGPNTAGPNAFLQCYAARTHGFSGALGGWSCGTLFDRVTVENDPIKFAYLDLDLQGGGWSSANSLCWQCRAPQIHLSDPPGAHNWAYGSRGQGYGFGSHAQHKVTHPEYFYYTQLALRKGSAPKDEIDKVIKYNPDFSQTDAAFAARQSERALEPAWTMERWIDTLAVRYPLAHQPLQFAKSPAYTPVPQVKKKLHRMTVEGGRIAVDGNYLAGGNRRTALWRGNLRPSQVNSAGVHLSRFVPGREGTGFTDNLDSVAFIMKKGGTAALYHFPALWYERRRDDHGRMMRADADVWAPFYEQPYSRSGKGEANDRLSRYDLDRWNPWYWSRVHRFAEIAEETGVVLVHEHYLQHNIIEEGAHWVDYLWRSANNINDLGLPEPTYMQGDKRVFMASQFYDLSNEKLVRYHRRYIRKNLDEVAGRSNVLNHIGVEYTGPLDFMEFWLQTVMDWEKETGNDVLVALNATKDVMDAVLADPHYSKAVDVIDIRQWYYRTDGDVYAPVGGVSLAPRQYARVMDVGTTDAECVWRAVREYRQKFPGKAVLYNASRTPGADWTAFIAGSSLAQIPAAVTAEKFYVNALRMEPVADDTAVDCHAMGKAGTGYILFTTSASCSLDLSADKGAYKLVWIDPRTGASLGKPVRVKGGRSLVLKAPLENGCVGYLYK